MGFDGHRNEKFSLGLTLQAIASSLLLCLLLFPCLPLHPFPSHRRLVIIYTSTQLHMCRFLDALCDGRKHSFKLIILRPFFGSKRNGEHFVAYIPFSTREKKLAISFLYIVSIVL